MGAYENQMSEICGKRANQGSAECRNFYFCQKYPDAWTCIDWSLKRVKRRLMAIVQKEKP